MLCTIDTESKEVLLMVAYVVRGVHRSNPPTYLSFKLHNVNVLRVRKQRKAKLFPDTKTETLLYSIL